MEEKMVYVGQKKFHYLLPLSMGASCLLLTSGAMAADTQMLQPAIEQSLLQHPHVAEANARVCQAIHRLGLNKAQARPQISLSVSGGRQLLERIKGSNGRPDYRGAAESGLRTVPARTVTQTIGGNVVTQTTPAHQVREESIDSDDISGAHKRDYSHRARNNVYDGTISFRYNLIDWGQSSGAIESQRLQHLISRIKADGVLGERSFQLLSFAARLSRSQQLLASQKDTAALINEQVEVVEARVKAGADRINDLREIKLLALDVEIEINRLTAEREQLLEALNIEYGLNNADAQHVMDIYLANRPEELAFLEATQTSQARALRLQIESVSHEERQIKGSRYMRVDAVVDGTVFDLADYEDEYEVVGRLEFKMPLYDGGTSRARLREAGWRSREFKSALDTHQRKHGSEMEQGTGRFNDLRREAGEE
ncbi:TolC family protein [Alphaproteobacteria bacterium]|nr:TolC family protein [Alphaproteobacteria bacterium]